jgi:hypothetical protein
MESRGLSDQGAIWGGDGSSSQTAPRQAAPEAPAGSASTARFMGSSLFLLDLLTEKGSSRVSW